MSAKASLRNEMDCSRNDESFDSTILLSYIASVTEGKGAETGIIFFSRFNFISRLDCRLSELFFDFTIENTGLPKFMAKAVP